MALETAPASTQSDGKWRITTVPVGSNAKSVAILNGATAKAITYGLTADGWAYSKVQATVEDKRLTLVANLARPGKTTESWEVKCVESTVADTADAVLAALALSGATIQILVRRGVDNATTHTVGQIADLHTVVVGTRRPQAPVENGVDVVAYTLYPVLPSESGVTLVA
jgi:hypothetical protein